MKDFALSDLDPESPPATSRRRAGKLIRTPSMGIEKSPAASALPLLQAALDALSAHVAVLDGRGTIIGVNRAWRRFGRQNGLKLPNAGIGSSYLAGIRGDAVATLRRRLREVLRARRAGFRHYYWCPTPKGNRCFEMQVRRCDSSNLKWVLVAHEDVTDLKVAEDGLRMLATQLARSRDTERRRLARELHDTTCQDLVAASLAAEQVERLLRGNAGGQDAIQQLNQALDRALRDLRTLSYLLYPPASAASSIADTLRTVINGFGHRAGMKLRFLTNYAGRPSEAVERAIVAVVQEALVNIHRHSGSKTARVALTSVEGSLALTITDRGKWRKGGEGVGLASMRERIAEVGGALTISGTRRGTRLFALFPTDLRPRIGF